MSHRGGDVGSYDFQSTGPRSAKMVCRNPYPCELDRGIIEAMATRFKPDDSLGVSVRHDDSAPCRQAVPTRVRTLSSGRFPDPPGGPDSLAIGVPQAQEAFAAY